MGMHDISGPKERLLNLDVRVKIIALAGALGLVLSHGGVGFPCFVALFSLGLCLWMRVPMRVVVVRFVEPLVIMTVLVALKSLSGTERMYALEIFGLNIAIYRDGLQAGLLIAIRLAAAIGLVTVLSVSTPFVEFFSGLGWFRVPRTFLEVMMFAFRYVRMLFEEAMVIYKSQKIRLGYSSLRRSFNSFGILVGSLVIKAFDHSINTTVALKQRGYEGSLPMADVKPFKPAELAGTALFLGIMGILWVLPLG